MKSSKEEVGKVTLEDVRWQQFGASAIRIIRLLASGRFGFEETEKGIGVRHWTVSRKTIDRWYWKGG